MGRRRAWVVLLGGAVGALVAMPAAGAHTIAPGVRNLVDGVVPALPGVTVTDRFTSADELTLVTTSATPVQVLAPTGEPFLRISRSGVQGNTNSVAWYASESLTYNPITSVPGVDPARGPHWITVSPVGRWSWFDPRLRPDQLVDRVPSNSGPRRLASWSVPLRLGSRSAAIVGHRDFRPVEGSYNQQLLSPVAPFAGVRVAVIGGAGPTPAAYLDNESGQSVTVPGAEGEPFLSFGPGGVLANAASPTWQLTAAAREEPPTGVVSASVPPRWEQVTTEHQFSWLDERGDAPGIDPPRGSGSTGPTVTVRRWSFSVVEGTRRATVSAAILWQPLKASAPGGRGGRTARTVAAVAAGAVVGAAVAAALVAWSRRRAAVESP